MANAKRRCLCCKDYGIAEDGIKTIVGWFIDGSHVLAYSKRKQEKDRAKQDRAERQWFKQRKREHYEMDYSYQFALTKKAAQVLANRLDAGLPCICCDEPRGNAQFCGGHAKSSGAHPELALSLLNIHGQRNALCNQHKSGNWSGDKHSKGFRKGLIDRYGQALVDYLESYHPPRKYTCDELIALRKEYAAEVKRLKSGLGPSKNWRALPEQEQA